MNFHDESSDSSQSSSISQEDEKEGMKLKIIRFEKHQEELKTYFQQMNHALIQPKQYSKFTFQALLAHEHKHQLLLLKVFESFSGFDLRPYKLLIAKYRGTIEQHQKLIANLDSEQDYLRLIRQSKLVDSNILEEYLHTISWKFYLIGAVGLVGAFLLHLIIGASNRWNMLNIYATSHYKLVDDPYLTTKEDSYAAPFGLFCTGVGMRLGLRLVQLIGPIPMYVLAISGACINLLASSFMPALPLFMMFNIALYALSASLVFIESTAQCTLYFPKHRIFINSLILTGNGLGHVLFGLINIQCMNPHHLPPSKGFYGRELDFISSALPSCMRQMALIVLPIGLLGIALMSPLISYNQEKEKSSNRVGEKRDFEYTCASEQQALQSKIFWIFITIILLATCGNYFLLTNFKNLVPNRSTDELYVYSVLLGFLLANAFSRFIWGAIFSKVGFKISFIIVAALNLLIFSTFPETIPNDNAYAISFIIGGAALGGWMVLFLNFNLLVFGEYAGDQLAGYIWSAYAFANLIQLIIVALIDTAKGFVPAFYAFIIANVLAIAMVINVKPQGNWENSMQLLQFPCLLGK